MWSKSAPTVARSSFALSSNRRWLEGARLAEPGEFTLRAFLHGRIDLVQAEAVRDLIDAVTPLQARAAYDQLEGTLTREIASLDRGLFDLTVRLEASLDFPEEGYHFVESGDAAREIAGLIAQLDRVLAGAARGRLIREGLQVVLAGRPNAGKSSLFNCLAGTGRAIVTATPGTTRDLVSETVEIEGIPMTVVDTAGVHGAAADPIEVEGIARAVAAATSRISSSWCSIARDRSMATIGPCSTRQPDVRVWSWPTKLTSRRRGTTARLTVRRSWWCRPRPATVSPVCAPPSSSPRLVSRRVTCRPSPTCVTSTC